jgi:hypothetical protein
MLAQAQKDGTRHSLLPECFSVTEEISGERENNLDRQSAYGRLLRAGIKNKG